MLSTSIDKFYNEKMNSWLKSNNKIAQTLYNELKYLRNQKQKSKKRDKLENLKRPIAVYSGRDRLKSGSGTEITLIFKSNACSWALSDSGGCTMCGYVNDRAIKKVKDDDIWAQFQAAISKYKELLSNNEKTESSGSSSTFSNQASQQVSQKNNRSEYKESNPVVFKLFTSGSFCDPKEISYEMQNKIISTLSNFKNVKEIVVESRPEYITDKVLGSYRSVLNGKYLEFGIGLETTNDFIRLNIINKGYSLKQFKLALERIHKYKMGVKAYLLFKPPFLSEQTSMIDLKKSIRDCYEMGVDTISINPTVIQPHTIGEELSKIKSLRPPWFFSLFIVLKQSLTPQMIKKMRVLCAPMASGKERGIHNCEQRDPSNSLSIKLLQTFVLSQDISVIPNEFKGSCWQKYQLSILEGL